MSKPCKTCGGRGRWRENISHTVKVYTDGYYDELDSEHIWHECNDCSGSGRDQDPEAGDDYDIGGDSYEDE